MTQTDFGTIDPNTKTGTQLATDLNDWRDTVHSSHRGASRPSYIVDGMKWVQEVSATEERVYLYLNSADHLLYTVNPSTGAVTPNLTDIKNLDDIANLALTAGQGLVSDGTDIIASLLVQLSDITATIGTSGEFALPYSGGTLEVRYGTSASSAATGYALATYTSAFPTNTLWAIAGHRATAASGAGGVKVVSVLTDQLFVGSFAARIVTPNTAAAIAGTSFTYVAIGN